LKESRRWSLIHENVDLESPVSSYVNFTRMTPLARAKFRSAPSLILKYTSNRVVGNTSRGLSMVIGRLAQPSRRCTCRFLSLPCDSPGSASQLSALLGCSSRTKPQFCAVADRTAPQVAIVYLTRYRCGCFNASLTNAALQPDNVCTVVVQDIADYKPAFLFHAASTCVNGST